MTDDPIGRNNVPPDWRDGRDYQALASMDRRAFAWEWLRRTPKYLSEWLRYAQGSPPLADANDAAAIFGLVAFEDPELPSGRARPVWRADVDRAVVLAEVIDAEASPGEGIDLLQVARYVTLAVDRDDDEHLLLTDGAASIRLDVIGGTLLGGRALLAYRLSGIDGIREPLLTLRRLVALVVTGRFARALHPAERQSQRWILELRVADALAAGASQQEIARALFGSLVSGGRWRSGSDTVRLRVRRLVRIGRRRSGDGAHLEWLSAR